MGTRGTKSLVIARCRPAWQPARASWSEWGEAGGLTRGRRTVAVTTMSMSLVFRVWGRGPREPEVGELLALEYSQVPKPRGTEVKPSPVLWYCDSKKVKLESSFYRLSCRDS